MGEFDYEHYRVLSQLIIRKQSDIEIWMAVFDVISTISPLRTPAGIAAWFGSYGSSGSSISLSDDAKNGRQGYESIYEDISTCTFRNVRGFFQKYMEGKDWTKQSKDVYNAVKNRHVDGRWIDFPDPPVQDAVCDWLSRFQDQFLLNAPGVYFMASTCSDNTRASAQLSLDIFVKLSGGDRSTAKHECKEVRVVGKLDVSNNYWERNFFQLCIYVRHVFSVQPTRRFVHGFTILGTTMELWIFDRSGPYSSGEFDIHDDPAKFIRAIAGYALMSDRELGLDTFVERKGGDIFITVTDETNGEDMRLQLPQYPIFQQRAIVCRGTTCYRVLGLPHIVKFSWTTDMQPPEAEYFRLAHRKGVKGAVSLLGGRIITSITEMRNGLIFPAPHNFQETSLDRSATSSQAQLFTRFTRSLAPSRSLGPFRGLSISESSSTKDKSVDDGSKPSKRLQSSTQRLEAYQEHNVRVAIENAQKMDQMSEDNEVESHEKSRSNRQRWILQHEHEVSQAVEKTQPPRLCYPEIRVFNNHLFYCLAFSPEGTVISEFKTIIELLAALRDAVKAHRSLYIQGGILHRDISEANIMITDPDYGDHVSGMLIDLDHAKLVSGGQGGGPQRVGTTPFMAIEVLRKADHTYRHDLESFLYVLLWICARRAWEREYECNLKDGPTYSMLTMWNTGSFMDRAQSKEYTMGIKGFEKLLTEFPQSFDWVKPVCRKIRDILFFPLNSGAIYLGTPLDAEELYFDIIRVFDNVINAYPA